MRSKIWGSVAVASTTFVLSACGSNVSDGEADQAGVVSEEGPIIIGAVVDRTAYLSSIDENVLAGMQCAVEALNIGEGVLGRELELVPEDNAADPQQTVQAFQRVMDQKPSSFANGFSSAGNAALAPLATQEEIPIVVASVVPEENFEWLFSTIVPARYETGTRVDYMVEQGIQRVGILHDPTPYGEQQLASLNRQLEESGIDVVGAEEHATDAVDLRPQVSNLLSAGAEAIVKVSSGPTQIVAANALADAGASVPLLIGIDSEANITQATEAYAETLSTVAPLQVVSELSADQRTEGMDRFTEACGEVQDPAYVGRGWDGIMLIAAAMEEAGTTDGAAVRQALEDMGPYSGTSATYDYTAEDHYGITTNPNYLARVTEAGVEIVLAPEG